MLQLNSEQVRLKSIRITVNQELATVDASGNSSSTDAAETGIKAKMMTVTGTVPFANKEHLHQLFIKAEALEGGARKVYRIANMTAETLGVKQVKFASSIEAVEQEKLRQWAVTFNLQEHCSVPQKVEERQPKKAASQQGTTGQSASNAEHAPPETEVELTGFLAVLKSADNALG